MTEYRRITEADVPQTLAFAKEGLRPERSRMVFSPARTEAVVRHFERSQTDFHLAAFDGDRMVGLVAAAVGDMPFFERCEAHVYVLYATVPIVGRVLIRRLLTWFRNSFHLRRLVWAQNDDADPRTHRLAQWCAKKRGMTAQELSMQVFYKGVVNGI